MSRRNQRHGRGRRGAAKVVRRFARFAKAFGATTRDVDFGIFEALSETLIRIRTDGTIVFTETATAPDCSISGKLVTLAPR